MEANEREIAVNKLVEDNVRLVYAQLAKWSLLDNQDAESDAFLALWKAADTFDASKGYAFSTYAYTCINNAIRQLLRAHKSTRQLRTIALETLHDTDDDRSNDAAMEQMLSCHETPESSLLFEELQSVVSEKSLLVYNRTSSDRQRAIVAQWLAADCKINQAEIAERLGVSQSYVSRSITTYKNNLKKALKGYL